MRKPKCQVLDQDEKRCLKVSAGWVHYHGDSEIYSSFDGKPGWVTVRMCKVHLETLGDKSRRTA